MTTPAYLIDTNVIIGLEDNHPVQPAFASLHSIASRHGVRLFVHEAARDDVSRDRNYQRRQISLSKIEKYPRLEKVRGLTRADLEIQFGPLKRPNDVVDATLLHALEIGAADFLVTEDNELHDRARRRSSELGRRVLHVADAVELLTTTYEPKAVPVRYVEEVLAHTLDTKDALFDSLRYDYPEFDDWWQRKCVREHRPCWVIDDGRMAGLVVRKDEVPGDSDATLPGDKILKVCTFKVRPEKRGIKLGELLLRKVMWFAQANCYSVVYLTTFKRQTSLIDLIEYYGFSNTYSKEDGELVYEKAFSKERLIATPCQNLFEAARLNYPRFVCTPDVRIFGVPIKEQYHDVLFPDLKDARQPDLLDFLGIGKEPRTPGNTIRKVYLCRAASRLGPPGSLLVFYKGKSTERPSQAVTAVGVFEDRQHATSQVELARQAGGRSVYSESELLGWTPTESRPVTVINFLLSGYIQPAINQDELRSIGLMGSYPPQSIFEIRGAAKVKLLDRFHLGFQV